MKKTEKLPINHPGHPVNEVSGTAELPAQSTKNQIKKLWLAIAQMLLATVLPFQPVVANTTEQPKTETIPTNSHKSEVDNTLYLPQLEKSKNAEEQLTESLRKYFPRMTELGLVLMTQPENTTPGVTQSIAAWQFWTDYFYPYYQESKELLQKSGISNSYFPETINLLLLNLLSSVPEARTTQNFDENGEVASLQLTTSYAYATAIVGEFIHLLQNRVSIEGGNSRLFMEGISNVLHFNGMVWWHALNVNAQKNGTPEKALLMPVLDIQGNILNNLSIEEFNLQLILRLEELQKIQNEADTFLYTYTTKEELGISQQYPAALQLLGAYAGKSPYFSYYHTMEILSTLASKLMVESVKTPRETFLLAPLLVQGTNYPLDQYPESVRTAVTQLREHNLLLSPEEWQQLVAQYSERNAGNLALHPVVAAQTEIPDIINTVKLGTYMIMINPDQLMPTFKELRVEDEPTVSLYFLEKDGQGVERWWSFPLEVKRQFEEATIFISVDIPQHIWIPGFLPRRISTAGRPLVLNVRIDQAEEAVMNYEANLQLQGQFAETAAVQSAQVFTGDEPVARPAEDPATPQAQNVTQTEPSAEAKAHWAELSKEVDRINAMNKDTFGEVVMEEDTEVSVAEEEPKDEEEVRVSFPEHLAILPEFEELQRRLNRELNKPTKK